MRKEESAAPRSRRAPLVGGDEAPAVEDVLVAGDGAAELDELAGVLRHLVQELRRRLVGGAAHLGGGESRRERMKRRETR